IIMSDSEHSTVTYTSLSSLPEQAPPSPDYVPGPEEPEQAPPSPVYIPYVPEPVYPEYIPPEDDVFPAKEQPLPAATSATADSPGYIPESDPEEEPEENDEDPEEDPADYPADRDDDDEEEEEEEDEDEGEEEKEEHPAPVDSVLPVHRMSHPYHFLLGKRVAGIRQRDTPPSPIHDTKIPEICLSLRKRSCHTAPTSGYEVGESSAASAARQDGPAVARMDLYRFVDMVDGAPGRPMSMELDYGITDTWDNMVGAIEEIAPTTRSLLRAQVKLLYKDRHVHRRLAVMIERERLGWLMRLGDYPWTLATMHIWVLIKELLAADHQRQVSSWTKAIEVAERNYRTQMASFLDGQHGPAKGLDTCLNAPGEVGSSS
ncbi:hypothetical protein Tco_0554556, partial [Tanacetum coccineum]